MKKKSEIEKDSTASKEKLVNFGKGIVKEIEAMDNPPSRPWPGAAPT